MDTLRWEVGLGSSLLLAYLAAFTLVQIGARSKSPRLQMAGAWARKQLGQALTEVQVAAIIIGGIALAATIAGGLIIYTSAARVCEGNEKTIQTAAVAYNLATNSWPASTTKVVVTSGTTTGTFANPNSTTEDYLQQAPIDPVNTSGSYAWSYTAASGTTAMSYSITCPGPHSKGSLFFISGSGSATAGKIELDSTGGFKAT